MRLIMRLKHYIRYQVVGNVIYTAEINKLAYRRKSKMDQRYIFADYVGTVSSLRDYSFTFREIFLESQRKQNVFFIAQQGVVWQSRFPCLISLVIYGCCDAYP